MVSQAIQRSEMLPRIRLLGGSQSMAMGVAIVLIGELGLALVAALEWRGLRMNGARQAAYAVTAAALVFAALMPLTYLVVDWPLWLRLTLIVPAVSVTFLRSYLIHLTGGPTPLWQLAEALQEINAHWERLAKANEASDEDEAWLVSRSQGLNRWRSSKTAEFIDLYQAQIADAMGSLGGRAGFRERAARRDARIAELINQLYGPVGLRNRRPPGSGI